MLLAIAILLVVTGIVMSAMMQMTMTQGTIGNRTEMHSSVRSATELLQQEIGQAGRVASPASITAPATLTGTGTTCTGLTGSNFLTCGAGTSAALNATSTSGLFPGEVAVIGPDSSVACPG